MPTESQRERVRFDMDMDGEALPNSTIDLAYEWAGEDYPGNDRAIHAQVRVIIVDRLWMAAAKRNDYEQNESVEKAGQLFDHLEKVRKKFQGVIDEVLSETTVAVNFGGLRRYNQRLVEYPDDYPFFPPNWDVSRFSS